MELRSGKQKKDTNDYAELKLTLTGLGFYEEGMQLTEMRHILQALQMSENDFEQDPQETVFSFTDTDNLLNSTMINNRPVSSRVIESPSSSPDPHYVMLTVHALVHHSLNWSPAGESVNLSNINNDPDVTSPIRKRFTEQSASTTAKRLCVDSIENAPDSGISLSCVTSSNNSPVSEENWDEDSLERAVHSSLQVPSEINNTVEDVSASLKDIRCSVISDESE